MSRSREVAQTPKLLLDYPWAQPVREIFVMIAALFEN